MNKSKTINFQEQEYFDDRMFVLYLCKGKVDITPDSNGIIWTTIYHEESPDDHIWCVVTYRNCPGYPIASVRHFVHEITAITYIWDTEPTSPLISLNGNSPKVLLPFDYQKFRAYKRRNNFIEFDYKKVFTPGGTNAEEIVAQREEDFKGIETK